MRLIVISPAEDVPGEARIVAGMLRHLPVTLHLRKPGQDDAHICAYLDRLPFACHRRIMLHDHWRLLDRFDLKGIHFTEKARRRHPRRIRRIRRDWPYRCLSSAFHRIADIPEPDDLFDYILLSPIFDSISKPGYLGAFDHESLKRFLDSTDHRVIALGGIDASRVATAARLGFSGVAVLGSVWNAPDPERAAGRLLGRLTT